MLHFVKHFAMSLLHSSIFYSHALNVAHMSFLRAVIAFANSLDSFICVGSISTVTYVGVYGDIQDLFTSFA